MSDPVFTIQPESSPEMAVPAGTGSFAAIDGVSLHYLLNVPEEGSIKGKILLIHGFGASTFCWGSTINSLVQEGYLTAAVDLPGFGFSDRASLKGFSQKDRSSLLWQLLSVLDRELSQEVSDMKWGLIGHSMGGGTASQMAMDEPSRTALLILVDGAVYLKAGPPFTSLLKLKIAQKGLKAVMAKQVMNPSNIRKVLASAYGQDPTEEQLRGYMDPLLLPGTDDALIRMSLSRQGIKLRTLKKSAIPLLAIWGSKDTIIPLRHGLRFKKEFPQAQFEVITGAAHCPMETHSDEFNKIVSGFISSTPPVLPAQP